MNLMKDKHKITSTLDFNKKLKSWSPLLEIANQYPLYVKFYTEAEVNCISSKMLSFYFGGILKQIKEWNVDTGYFCYAGTETPIVDVDVLDSFFRKMFYYTEVSTAKTSEKIAKTLKLNKANRKEVCEYFETIINTMARFGCLIESMELNNIKSMIGE